MVLPRRNEKDLVDVPDDVKEGLTIHLVDAVDDVLPLVIEPAVAA